jgi:hypothetical protein
LKVEVFLEKEIMGRFFFVSVVFFGFVAVVVVIELEVMFDRAITGSAISKSLEILNYELERIVKREQ